MCKINKNLTLIGHCPNLDGHLVFQLISRICSDRMAKQSWNCLAEEKKWSENGQWPAVILHTETVSQKR